MATLYPDPSASLHSTVTNASQQIEGLVRSGRYTLCSTVPLWIAQGENPTATAGAGSMFWPAAVPLPIFGTRGEKLAVLRSGGSDGDVSVTPGELL